MEPPPHGTEEKEGGEGKKRRSLQRRRMSIRDAAIT